MNKLNTTDNGGFPLDLDDIRWLQDGIAEGFKGLLSAFGINPADSFIISGCAVVDNAPNYDIAEGYISLNGEVLYVPAHSLAQTGGHTYYWDLEVTYDSSGLESFRNGTSYDTYEIRRGKLKSTGSPTGSEMPLAAPTLNDKLKTAVDRATLQTQIDEVRNAWSNKTLSTGDVKLSGGTNLGNVSGNIRYLKFGKTFVGCFNVIGDIPGSSSGTIRVYLPAGVNCHGTAVQVAAANGVETPTTPMTLKVAAAPGQNYVEVSRVTGDSYATTTTHQWFFNFTFETA